MKVLWISAHPDSRSLSSSLRQEGTNTLTRLGHEVRESDLYAMKWKPTVDAGDFPEDFPEETPEAASQDLAGDGPLGGSAVERLFVGDAQERAYRERALSADIAAEQEKTRWADVLVFHFPMWWLGPPAILKGWFDRVLTQGFAFGVKDPDGVTLRYGDGGLSGRRAMVVTSIGARESGFGPRGIHGHIDDILFPLHHGTFWYTGMDALPPFVVYGADRLTEDQYAAEAERLRDRLRTLPTAAPIPFRHERGGDYDADLVLREEIAPGRTGFDAHRQAGVRTGALTL